MALACGPPRGCRLAHRTWRCGIRDLTPALRRSRSSLAGASYRWVEQPVRRLGFRACILTARHRLGASRRALRLVTATGVVATFAYAAVLASAPTTTATQAELTANTSSAPDTTSRPVRDRRVNVQEVATTTTSPAIPGHRRAPPNWPRFSRCPLR